MHIPDGLMAPAVSAIGWALAMMFLALAFRVLNRRLDDRQITLMAVLAAGIFVAQMLNFPIGGGTTGHLLGAALASVILGPLAAMTVLTVILVIQGLVFGDGGLTALGLNILNMAVVGCLVAWYAHRAFSANRGALAVATAAWMSVFVAALAATIELSTSFLLSGGEYGIEAGIAFPSMLAYHALIGIGEAIITVGVVAYLARVSPEMLRLPKMAFIRNEKEAVADA